MYTEVPGLGDIPILGALFRSIQYQRNITELVILVTPEIVAPLNPLQVPSVPGSDLVEPNDFELYTLGLLEGRPDDGEGSSSGGEDQALVATEPDSLNVHGPWGHSSDTEGQ